MLETLPGTTLHTFNFVMESGSSPALRSREQKVRRKQNRLVYCRVLKHTMPCRVLQQSYFTATLGRLLEPTICTSPGFPQGRSG